MSSPIRIYYPSPVEVQGQIFIEGEEHHYLAHVHRAHVGDRVVLFGHDSREREGVIEGIERGEPWHPCRAATALQIGEYNEALQPAGQAAHSELKNRHRLAADDAGALAIAIGDCADVANRIWLN